MKLTSKKNSSGEISPAIIKLAKKEILIPITNCINKCISIKSFPDDLKVADVIPVFKKEDPNNKANYRPISLLPTISKIFERVLFEQIEKFSEKILSLKSCGFRKGYSTRHALLNLLKNWQKTSDKSGVLGAALMDLSKVYDCIPHDLLIAKSSAYGFEDSATSLISDYLPKRYQRVKIGSAFSSYLEILRVVPQGSILGLIRLNIFINDLMFFIQEIEVYNFTMYSSSLNYKEAAHKLSNDTYIVLNWLRVNSMVANSGKFQIMFLGSKIDNSKITFAIENKQIKCKREVKLLGITIDEKLTFTKHIANICSLANNKLRALTRVRRFFSMEQAKYLSEAYIMSAFKYCTLIWMFCNKTSNNQINKIHKRTLRLVYEMENPNFEDLLLKDNLWNVHENNIQR